MSASAVHVDAVLAELTSFQQDTVAHVIDRFHGDDPGRRFLVADQTGLGKTKVARGVIARTIELLDADPAIDRIDIVYVCSNADLARQNLADLNVTGQSGLESSERLSLLALNRNIVTERGPDGATPVNLVAFTPGTSLGSGRRFGSVQERALLYLLLEEELDLSGWTRHSASVLLQGSLQSREKLLAWVDELAYQHADHLNRELQQHFLNLLRDSGLDADVRLLLEKLGRRRSLPDELWSPAAKLVGRLITTLSRASVEFLEPDLVILDEFQRFGELLDPASDAGALAGELFGHRDARVLMLSATPYKPFTYAEESAVDDHHRDFMRTVAFLVDEDKRLHDDIAQGLKDYRAHVLAGQDAAGVAEDLSARLRRVMTRQERPDGVDATMTVDLEDVADGLAVEDLLGYAALSRAAALVDAPMPVDYWKSVPYFANFMHGYALGARIEGADLSRADRAALDAALTATQRLSAEDIAAYRRVPPGNARLAALQRRTVDAGWWQLLWLPPSLPYLTPGGPYAEPFAQNVTKQLVFSSWAATPTAIAGLLSHTAECHLRDGVEGDARGQATRLSYRMSDGRPAAMTTLALFWPMPGLARLGDPFAACTGGEPVTPDVAEQAVAADVRDAVRGRARARGSATEGSAWVEALGRADSQPGLTLEEIARAMSGQEADEDDDGPANLSRHVEEAKQAPQRRGAQVVAPEIDRTVARLAVHSPGNIAYRSLLRICGDPAGPGAAEDGTEVSAEGLWAAAAVLAAGLRSLFSRPQTALLLDRLVGDGVPYWQAILTYCAWGNLQAVLDEHVHHLRMDPRFRRLDDDALRALATEAAGAITLRPAAYQAHDPVDGSSFTLTARFALRYGDPHQRRDGTTSARGGDGVRQGETRRAFNSPFWPFVLATTSVGQEGIDFHRWCHSLVHWNTPANPVDFEQRQGRIDRYAGHAVRRNLMERHGAAIRRTQPADPWRLAYELGCDERENLGEFAPHWVYPGSARIERRVAPFVLSQDVERLERLRRDLRDYRLTFGQPRQEDLLEVIRCAPGSADPDSVPALLLRPPSR